MGQHLKKKRFLAGVRQREAAVKLGVSARTLSLWECDRIYPPWASQPGLIAYLGYDPFTETGLKTPKGNETSCVAFFSSDAPLTLGQKIKQHRLKSRKSRKQFASELGVSQKMLWGWETDRWQPTFQGREIIAILDEHIAKEMTKNYDCNCRTVGQAGNKTVQ